MYRISNLNKLKNFNVQVLVRNLGLCLIRKKSSKIYKECLKKFFWPKILTINTLCVNVCRKYECYKNQMPYYNVKSFKKSNF